MKTKYSDYWIDDNYFNSYFKKNPDGDLEYLQKHKRTISKFVKILTNDKVQVNFQLTGNESYTDGKSITIGSDITEENYDSVVGLALHESTHITDSNFHLINDIFRYNSVTKFMEKNGFSDTDIKYITNRFSKYSYDILSLLNVIEDRRIDNLAMMRAPGYSGYYHEMYLRYFFNEKSKKVIDDPRSKKETFKNYIVHILGLIRKDIDINSLKILNELNTLIDFKTINRLKGTKDALVLTFKASILIIKQIEKEVRRERKRRKQEQSNDDPKPKNGQGDDSKNNDESKSGDTNKPNNNWTPELNNEPYPDKIYDRYIEEIIDNINGYIDKQTVSDQTADIINKIEKLDLDNIKKSLSGQNVLIMNYPTHNELKGLFKWNKAIIINQIDYINSGFQKAKLLAKKIKFKDENFDIVYSRQKSGKIDSRIISEIASDNFKIFKRVVDVSSKPVNIHFSIDVSLSMRRFWKQTIEMISMFAKTAKLVDNLDVSIDIRLNDTLSLIKNEHFSIFLWNSKLHDLKRFKKIFSIVQPRGLTPETVCLSASIDSYRKMYQVGIDNLFVNISDGSPNCSYGNVEDEASKIQKSLSSCGYSYKGFFVSEPGSIFNRYNSMYNGKVERIDTGNVGKIGKIITSMIRDSK